MGWSGYDLYDGDGTFTFQLLILEKAGIPKHRIYDSTYVDNCPTCGQERRIDLKTYSDHETIRLSDEDKKILLCAYPKIVKYLKLKPTKTDQYYTEDWSINWQMFADLLMNNNLPLTKQIKKLATQAATWLTTDFHCGDFSEPRERRAVTKAFAARLNKYKVKKK